MQEWQLSPRARGIAGGTTATLAAIAAALAARKAFGGKEDEAEVEKYAAKLDLVKKALMGQGVPALRDADGKTEQFGIPVRDGVVTTHRNEIFSNLDRWSRGR